MPLADQRSGATPSAEALRFGCPGCRQELSIPADLAGIEGPCPLCGELIAAPVPAVHLPARLLSIPEGSWHTEPEPTPDPQAYSNGEKPSAPTADWPTPPSSPPTPQPPDDVVPELPVVRCEACGCELAIDPELAYLPGGPCPRCQTWIDLQGRTVVSAAPSPPSDGWAASTTRPSPDTDRRPHAAGTELNRTIPATSNDRQDLNFRRMVPQQTVERRRVKKRKKRRQLPPEFYVGHAAGDLDAKGQETAQRMRRTRLFPERNDPRRDDVAEIETADRRQSPVARYFPVLFGVVIPLLGGLYAALHFSFIEPDDFRFWKGQRSESQTAFDPLAEGIARTERVLEGKAKESYRAVERAVHGFFEADSWETAESHLRVDELPEQSEALAFLKMFPRESFRGAAIRVIDFARIPQTERFVFTTHVSKGVDQETGEERLTFMVVEEMADGTAKIHALQLYQSWRHTLTEFLETSGSLGSRFYVALHRIDEEPTIKFPNDGPYVKLEVQDLLVERPWIKEVYVRKESWAGTRLLAVLGRGWGKGVLDLEWRQGPAGDAFVNVAAIHPSPWGNFAE